jgi:pimeloyl-ACP methyl ester carboxylesterase
LRDAAIVLPDGRRLAFTEWGAPDGRPVFSCHGRPGSRLWCPDEEATAEAGVRLVIPDRPGIGRSDPLEGRTLADWPRDVIALADALGLATFGVIGVSGGGTYGLACAALIPDRLTAVADVSSGISTLDWAQAPDVVEGWPARVRARFELARTDRFAAAQLAAAQWTDEIQFDLDPAVAREELESVDADRWFFDDPTRAAALDEEIREYARQGADGLKWDLMDFVQPWGFELADIRVPVSIWHGAQDTLVTQDDVDTEAQLIPTARVVVWQDSGHLGVAKHWRDILEAVA